MLPIPKPPATPLLQAWGDELAPAVVDLIHHAPHLAARMMLLPARGLHATAVALHTSKTMNEPVEILASRISVTHPKELLRQAMPLASPALYALLGRATVPAWDYDTYLTFERLLRSRVASTLTDAKEISPDRVASAAALLEIDPIVWRARKSYRYDHERRHLATVVEMLRSLGLLHDLAELPEGAGRDAVFRRVRSDLARARASVRPFPVVSGWNAVESVGELWAIGERLKVCTRPGQWGAAGYALGLIKGEHVFLHEKEHDLLAQIHHVANDLWAVVQVAGAGNRCPKAVVRKELDEALTAAGLRLVLSQPDHALSDVLRRERERDPFFDHDEGGLDTDIAA